MSTQTPAWLRNRPIAHRGLHGNPEIPENSILAFDRAIEAGHPIELDVRRTHDGEWVVFHDEDLRRVCGREGKICDLPLSDLRDARLFGGSERVPTLKQVLSHVAGRVPLLIELKREKGTPDLAPELVNVLSGYTGPFAVQSFHPETVRNLRRLSRGRFAVGLLSGRMESEGLTRLERLLLRFLLLIPYVRPDFIAYEWEGMPGRWLRVLRLTTRLPLLLWTVRTEAGWRVARTLGANVIFEGALSLHKNRP